MQLRAGDVFANRFEIDKIAGSGGMGTVYRARDRFTASLVALKLLHTTGGESRDAERFLREAQLLSELHHPGIVSYVAHGQTPDGQRYLAMEWLDGEDLAQRLASGPLPLRDVLQLIQRVAEALALAHQRGIVHRDLKPTNLFLPAGDIQRAKVLDFGIARRITASKVMTNTGLIIGTPEYMSPEQARGARDLTPATDVFSLGCVLYECLTGEPPFIAEHIAAVLVRILFEEPTPLDERRPGVPDAVAELLVRMLKKDPAQRIPEAGALAAAFAQVGEVQELSLLPTLTAPAKPASAFAASEQVLFSLVVAASPVAQRAANWFASDELADSEQRAMLLSAVRSQGGQANFLLGDTLVVTLPQTGSATDQAELAARIALHIKERWPVATVAVATGRGTAQGQTTVGEVADRAAKLLQQQLGEPHDTPTEGVSGVWVDELSAGLLGPRFFLATSAGGTRLLREEKDVDASRPLLGKPTPCVGRDTELATLEAQLAGCIEDSEPRVVLVTAPPGIGKSRLRHEFLRRVGKMSEPLTIILGRGDLVSAGSPYGVLATAVRRFCQLSGSEPMDQQRQQLHRCIGRKVRVEEQARIVAFIGELCNVEFPDEGMPMLQAARQDPKIMHDSLRRAFVDWLQSECQAAPVLLVIDDLQWGDALTISLIDEMLREWPNAPLFVLAFARPEIHETFPRLWRGQKLQEIVLKGLSKRACERLLQQVLGKNVSAEAMARAVEQSAGNALFLEELIRALAQGKEDEHPETVVAMLQARIGRLDAGSRRTVRAASVFGQTFWQGGVAAILGLPKSAPEVTSTLNALLDIELIQVHANSSLPSEQEYDFRHALVRDAAYSLLTDEDLATGHKLAGEFLTTAGEGDAAVIADHFERGGDKGRAADFYRRAAEYNLERWDALGTLRQVDRGLKCSPEAECLGQLRSMESAANARILDYERADKAATVALQLLPPGSRGWCRAMMPAAYASLVSVHGDGGRTLVDLLLATEPEADGCAAYTESLSYVTSLFALVGSEAMVQALLRRLTAIVKKANSTNPTLHRHLSYCEGSIAHFRQPRPWTTLAKYGQAISGARAVGDRRLEAIITTYRLERVWLELGDLDGALKRLLGCESLALQHPEITHLWRLGFSRALCESPRESSWSEAEQLVAPVFKNPGGAVNFPAIAHGILARIALQKGQPGDAEIHSRAAMQRFSLLPLQFMDAAAVHLRVLLALGQVAEATATAARVLATIPFFGGAGQREVEIRLAASYAFHHSGDHVRAHVELREAIRQIGLRADDITDPVWRDSYLTRNPYCGQARQLAYDWGLV